ncbi:hypothetical protein BJ741DRAFT_556087 [Chytriomyces cf. hyalinus JEL632]|nr:hypothetical protein BJ741DRAFT_556087 [Chytriomyces cf. hyalinus JEL632]
MPSNLPKTCLSENGSCLHKKPMTATPRNAALLNAVYDFAHMAPSDSQSLEDVTSLIYWISARGSPVAFSFNNDEKESLRQACFGLTSAIPQQGVPVRVYRWFPGYGCALLLELICEGMLGVKLLFPDRWAHKSKRIATGESVEYSVPLSNEAMFFSTVDSDLFISRQFEEAFDKALMNAETRTGDRRTAAAGQQGHQKTPAFIAALVRQVLASTRAEEHPFGGTTDVGLHTGGRPRCTSWPLVFQTLKLLIKSTSVFNRFISEFHLRNLQTEIIRVQDLAKRCTLTPTDIDEAFAVLSVAAEAVQKIETDSRVNITEAVRVIKKAEECLSHAFRSVADAFSSNVADKLASYRAACIDPEPVQFQAKPLVDMSATIQSRRNQNIGLFTCFDDNSDGPNFVYNFESLLLWGQKSLEPIDGVSRVTSLVLVLQTMESFMWKQAKLLNSEIKLLWTSDHMKNIKSLEEMYNKAANESVSTHTSRHAMKVISKSKSVLVTHIFACLSWKYANQEYPLLKKYGIPLDASQLEVLVIKDLDALKAMLLVRRFLDQNRKGREMTVFSIDEMGGTFSFALEFAEESERMSSRYLKEVSKAEDRKAAYWGKVVVKQNDAVRLRAELQVMEDERENLRLDEEESVRNINDNPKARGSWHRALYASYNENVRRLRGKDIEISRKRTQIESAIVAPPFVKNPLPKDKEQAMTIIFFAEMPEELNTTVYLICSAQSSFGLINAHSHAHGTTWRAHYESIDQSSVFFESFLQPHAVGVTIPSSFGERNVDSITDPASCVWHPITSKNGLSYISQKNPWNFKNRDLWSAFVEKLPQNFESLQWAIDAPSMNSNMDSRGNQVYSKLSQRPAAFSRLGFEAFGKLRAHPNLQIRHIINLVLRENLMPLDDDLTVTIVQQALYQVGEVSSKQELLWKFDWDRGQTKECMSKELLALANQIRPTPRRYKDLMLLGDLAGFLAQYSEDFSEASFQFSEIAEDWANDIRTELNESSTGNSNEKNIQLKAKECVMIGYAIICLSHVHFLDEDAVGRLCKLSARFTFGQVFAPLSDYQSEILMLQPLVTETMIRHEQTIRSRLTNLHLSDAVNFVIPSYNIPKSTVWSSSEVKFCFDSMAEDQLFSINVVTGRILVDGLPPGRLPPSILNHALYQKHFGVRDFQIQPVGPSFMTVDLLNGCFYDFALNDSNLVILERNVVEKTTLQLVDFSVMKWWANLPVRLREMHSHWFCSDRRALCMRPIDVTCKAISFIALWKNPELSESSSLRKDNIGVFAIGIHDSELTFETLLMRTHAMDQFVHLEGQDICNAVSRLEEPAFVHTLLSPKNEVIISLPRFRLSFTQSSESFQWMSQQHKGYRLRSNQRLDNAALPFFKQYLILENPHSKNTQIMLPMGRLAKTEDGFTEIVLSKASNAILKAASYELHPITKLLKCASISNRLLLAAILSTSGTFIRDPCYRMTGSELAIQYLRECWLNKPLSDRKVDAIEDAMAFSYREPAVGVLCNHIKFSANQLGFLFPKGNGGITREAKEFSEDFLKGAVASCTQLAKSRPGEENTRRSLTNFELTPSFGRFPSSRIEEKYYDRCINVAGLKIPTDAVAFMEQAQVNCLSWTQRLASGFPLNLKEEAGEIERLLNAELEDSWTAHITLQKPHLPEKGFAKLSVLLSQQLPCVSQQMSEIREYLSVTFAEVPTSQTCEFNLSQSVNLLPKHTFSDILRIAFDKRHSLKFNPYLSDLSLQNIVDAVLVLLELHVIHTRIERLQRDIASKPYEALLKDIFVRKWSIRKYPKWLVFEVEGGIQIRPNQYATALQMMDKPSSIVQLNMGEGKTRVIMPMILLANSSQSLSRVTVLNPLLNEVYGHMHSTLTASILGLHILQMPFHRQIGLDQIRVRKMIEFAKLVRSVGGFLITTPEYQLSLNLKLQEVQISGDPINGSLHSFFSTLQFKDIVDESDAVLSHRYQLVYAVGHHTSLSDGPSRWCLVHAILDLLNTNPVLQNLLNNKFVMRDNTVSKAQFQCLRLAPRINGNEEQEKFLTKLSNGIMQVLVENPPYEMTWLKSTERAFIEALNVFVTTRQTTLQSLLSIRRLSQVQTAQILMLRGLLAFGLLEHCLSLRHAVDYGLDTRRQKRMAVPFTAVSVPSERAEFSHPDIVIILTALSFFHVGLTNDQVKAAISFLLTLAKGSQQYYYTRWFKCVQSELTPVEADSISRAEKLDLTNSSKVELLCRTYSKSTNVISFWLEKCVYPADTQHYSKRIGSSAWNLASGSHVVGFSGTNDNALLLPAQVNQVPSEDASLRGTNGMMIERIISKTEEAIFFPAESIWDQLVSHCVSIGAVALIDTGCLLAGTSNASFAKSLMKLVTPTDSLRGILYFDMSFGDWMVLDIETSHVTTESQSAIPANMCFVIFDDARTRGVDKKLAPDALALVTLGPKLKKDKLMQGAGRMRQLDAGQRLAFCGTSEVEQNIRMQLGLSENEEIGTTHILRWTLINNKNDLSDGLLQWADQGIHFESCRLDQSKAEVDEDWGLESLYAVTDIKTHLPSHIEASIQARVGGCSELCHAVAKRTRELGQQIEVQVKHDQECERELQQEKEKESEREVQIASEEAVNEPSWAYNSVLTMRLFIPFGFPTSILPLKAAASMIGGLPGLKHADWSIANVWATQNFCTTVLGKGANYLRSVDCMLYFPTSEHLLLVSEKEADGILREIWNWTKPESIHVALIHLSQLRSVVHQSCKGTDSPGGVQLSTGGSTKIPRWEEAAIAQVFNGDSNITPAADVGGRHLSRSLKLLLENLTRDLSARHAVPDLVASRGRSSEWDFSQMKTICERS